MPSRPQGLAITQPAVQGQARALLCALCLQNSTAAAATKTLNPSLSTKRAHHLGVCRDALRRMIECAPRSISFLGQDESSISSSMAAHSQQAARRSPSWCESLIANITCSSTVGIPFLTFRINRVVVGIIEASSRCVFFRRCWRPQHWWQLGRSRTRALGCPSVSLRRDLGGKSTTGNPSSMAAKRLSVALLRPLAAKSSPSRRP